MRLKKLLCPLAVALAFAATAASAQQPEPRGWYVGGSVGQMEAKGDCGGFDTCDRKDTAWKLFGGYRINRHFAAEAFYGDWGKIKVARGAVSATGELQSYGIAGLGILPVGQAFELFGKLGLAHTKQKATATGGGVTLTDRDSGSEAVFGLGAGYNFTPRLGVRAEWERLNDSEVDVISLGLQYRF